MTDLPDKPSELLELGISDMQKIKRRKGYDIDMGDWHAPSGGICHVCMAGAMMAGTLKADPLYYYQPSCMGENIDKLIATDSFRSGYVRKGLVGMGIRDQSIPDRIITEYEYDSKAFYRDMRKLIRDLKEEGL